MAEEDEGEDKVPNALKMFKKINMYNYHPSDRTLNKALYGNIFGPQDMMKVDHPGDEDKKMTTDPK